MTVIQENEDSVDSDCDDDLLTQEDTLAETRNVPNHLPTRALTNRECSHFGSSLADPVSTRLLPDLTRSEQDASPRFGATESSSTRDAPTTRRTLDFYLGKR